MDTLAQSLELAAALLEGKKIQGFVDERYAGWKGEVGKSILSGNTTLEALWKRTLDSNEEPKPVSGRQELLENWVRQAK
jgi:xylose isomerase